MTWTQDFVEFVQRAPAPVENVSEAMWLIIAFPLAGALLSGLFGRMLGRANTGLIASAAVAGSFLVSVLVHWTLNDPTVNYTSMHGAGMVPYAIGHDYGTWFSVGDFSVKFGLWADHLTSTMLLVITGVGLLIHIYSTSYMSHDAGYWRYFAYLNLFVAMMLTLVLADNLVLLFVGWEGVGLCSYLLIGFWYTDPAKAWAGRKAFITNRIGDFAFIVAMCLLVVLTSAYARQSSAANFPRGNKAAYEQGLSQTGPLNFQSVEALSRGIGSRAQPGVKMGMDTLIQDGPLKGFTVQGVVTVILLLFLLGAAGKSAQLPLYVWLPDAMAGPTPVSALIHAATMVTAGVYLFSRLSYLLVLSPLAMTVIAVIGTLTALIAALIAFAQDDIKKVLAYSTVSQLGIMFMGVGFGVFWAAVFHLVTHAFFKACLFLGAGSVMHGNADETDIKKLGGLRKEMPFTHWTFAISWAAITGIVPLSGFFSKDAILHGIHATTLGQYAWATNLVYYLGLLVALCTAFYMTRLYLLTFWGKRSPEAKVAHAHESDFAMTVPLMILSGLAILGALFYLIPMNAGGRSQPVMENFLDPVFRTARQLAPGRITVAHGEAGFSAYLIAWVIVALGGAAAWFLYTRFFPSWRAAGKPVPGFARAARGFAVAKFYVDELYEAVLLRPIKWIAKMLYQVVDALLIDTVAVRGTGWVVSRLGAFFRYSQTGDVQRYAAVMALALVIGVAYVIFAL